MPQLQLASFALAQEPFLILDLLLLEVQINEYGHFRARTSGGTALNMYRGHRPNTPRRRLLVLSDAVRKMIGCSASVPVT